MTCASRLPPTWIRLRQSLVALLLCALSACRVTNLPIWSAASVEPGVEIVRIRDVDYGPALASEPFRHQLDLFLPKGVKDYPVVVFVHGGAWMVGDNRLCGLYSSVGEFLAYHGIGAILPNYRQSPGVKHPEHVKDVARAFAWTHAHIADYGGRPDQLFLAGHSAGGHLVALLATDERYLHDEGLSTANIKGVIAVSGVYRIPPGKLDLRIGGLDERSFRLDELAPLRGDHGGPCALTSGHGLALPINLFGPAFGADPSVRADASPLSHVRPGLPPFLLFYAERDLPTLAPMAEEFYQALRQQGCDVQLNPVAGRNHNSIMFMASAADDPVGHGLLDFVRRHCASAPSSGRS